MQRKNLFILFFFFSATLLLYLPAINATWQFDDLEYVLHRNTIGQDSLLSLLTATFRLGTNPKGTRSLVNATFLLNWKVSHNPLGFHLVNIAIHSVTAYVVYLLLMLFLKKAQVETRQVRTWALAGSLLFLIHPLQSQAVAYITQRFESLSALFYLGSLYLFLTRRYLPAWIIGFLAVSAKETAITLPFAIFAADVYLQQPLWWQNLKKQALLYIVFFLLSLKVFLQILIPATIHISRLADPAFFLQRMGSATHAVENYRTTRTEYFLTQVNVIPQYIVMLILPWSQSIDHDVVVTQTIWQWPTPLSLAFLLGLITVMIIAAKRQPIIALTIFFFFLTISVSSSIFPIDDLMNEHRVYLPMFGFILLFIWLSQKLVAKIGSKSYSVLALWFLLLTVLTFKRSLAWSTPLALWEDAWHKAPHKARTNKNYGFLLTQNGRLEEGVVRLEEAVKLRDIADYHRNLGLAYLQAGRFEQAQNEFAVAVKEDPADARALSDLGVTLAQLGKKSEAVAAFGQAVELDPGLYEARIGLGGVSVLTGDYPTAETHLLKAVELEPADLRGYNNLLILYFKTKEYAKALSVLAKIAVIDPNYPGLAEKIEAAQKGLKQAP